LARFFGRYEHSLDIKGRVILPARFRRELGTAALLTKNDDRCLALWTQEAFEQKLSEMEVLQQEGRDQRNLVRVWAQGATEVEIDRQGRMAIPGFLREFARLEGDVLINGAINRVELWDPSVWEERIAPSERRLTEEDDPQQTIQQD
jgi:MraZ protein